MWPGKTDFDHPVFAPLDAVFWHLRRGRQRQPSPERVDVPQVSLWQINVTLPIPAARNIRCGRRPDRFVPFTAVRGVVVR